MRDNSQLLNTLIADVMSTDIIVLHPDTTMQRVDDAFKKHNIHHLPVVNEDREMVGIISRVDHARLLHSMTLFKNANAEKYNVKLLASLLAKDVMIKRVVHLSPDNNLGDAFDIFKQNTFHALPIVGKDNKLEGILTTFDLLNFAYAQK